MSADAKTTALAVTYIVGDSEHRDYFNSEYRGGKLHAWANFGEGTQLYPLEKRGGIFTFAEDDKPNKPIVSKKRKGDDRKVDNYPAIKRTSSISKKGEDEAFISELNCLLREHPTVKIAKTISEGYTILVNGQSVYDGMDAQHEHLIPRCLIERWSRDNVLDDDIKRLLLLVTYLTRPEFNAKKWFTIRSDIGVMLAPNNGSEKPVPPFAPSGSMCTSIDQSYYPFYDALKEALGTRKDRRAQTVENLFDVHKESVVEYCNRCEEFLMKSEAFRRENGMLSISEALRIHEAYRRTIPHMLTAQHWLFRQVFVNKRQGKDVMLGYIIRISEMIVNIREDEKEANRKSEEEAKRKSEEEAKRKSKDADLDRSWLAKAANVLFNMRK